MLTFRPSQDKPEALIVVLLQDHRLLLDDAVTVERVPGTATIIVTRHHDRGGSSAGDAHHRTRQSPGSRAPGSEAAAERRRGRVQEERGGWGGPADGRGGHGTTGLAGGQAEAARQPAGGRSHTWWGGRAVARLGGRLQARGSRARGGRGKEPGSWAGGAFQERMKAARGEMRQQFFCCCFFLLFLLLERVLEKPNPICSLHEPAPGNVGTPPSPSEGAWCPHSQPRHPA